MPSRFTSLAVAIAATLLLAACEQEAQQEPEVGQAEEPAPAQPEEPTVPDQAEAPAGADQPGEQQTAEQAAPAEPAPAPPEEPTAPGQAEAPAGEDQSQEQRTAEQAGDEEILVVPPADEAAQSEDQRQGRAPGEQSPQAAGVASVAAYVGRWADEPRMCQENYWTFTNLRLQSPDDLDCDIQDTEERQDGLALNVACTERDEPLAEPDEHTMALTFPNMPQTDTMVVSGGPISDELTLTRCQLGQEPAAGAVPAPQNR